MQSCWVQQHHFVIVIHRTTMKNGLKRISTRVFTQEYQHYEVIYIDDCSQDHTYELAKRITQDYQQEKRMRIIHNTERYGAMANLYTTIHSCEDNSIIVTLDGDDWFPDAYVLQKLNNYYAGDVWMTYGQFQEYPSNKIGHCIPFPESIVNNNAFRTFHTDRTLLPASHLRTFHAWLFKSIKLEDLLFQEYFYTMGWDIAFICPMLEMSGRHQICIQDILYIYNIINPLSDCYRNATLQWHSAQHALAQRPYNPLQAPRTVDTLDSQDTASLILLASHRLENLYGVVSEIVSSVKSLNKVYVLYIDTEADKKIVRDISTLFPSISWISYTPRNFKMKFEECMQTASGNYVLLTTDTVNIIDCIDSTNSIAMLNHTQAAVFYFGLAKSNAFLYSKPNLAPANRDHSIYGWFSTNRTGTWHIPVIDGSLWRKKDLQKLVSSCSYTNQDELRDAVQTQCVKANMLGLMGLQAKTSTEIGTTHSKKSSRA